MTVYGLLLSYSIASFAELEFGIFAGGADGGSSLNAPTPLQRCYKWTYSDDSIVNSATLIRTTIQGAGVSNYTNLVMARGYDYLSYSHFDTQKYIYSNDTVVNGTNLVHARINLSGSGTISTGYFFGGQLTESPGTAGSVYATVGKYSYSSDSTSAGTNLNSPVASCSGASGNSTKGVIFYGTRTTSISGLSTTSLAYTYSNESTLSTNNIQTNRTSGAATGNKSTGYFGGGQFSSPGRSGPQRSNLVDRYFYDTDSRASGANLSRVSVGLTATGNLSRGIFIGGDERYFLQGSIFTTKYSYTSETAAASTNLPVWRHSMNSGGSTPNAC